MKNNKVLVIFPLLGHSGDVPSRPPLGVITIAAPLVEMGLEVTILDERVEDQFDEKLISELRREPICVGISSMSGHHITSALRISKIVKENSKIPVVWGGVQASLEPESTIKHDLIDIIVRDDGEESFPMLLKTLDNGDDLSQVDGIAYKENGNVIFTGIPKPADIEKLPRMPYHLIDFNKYKSGSRNYWTTDPRYIIPLETSRGCPYNCIFCTESVRKKKWRALSPERVVQDIKFYVGKYGIKNFSFVDDNLFGIGKRGEEVTELLIEGKMDIRWSTNIRTDYVSTVDKEILDRIEKSGCRMLTFGAESGSERILEMINKKAHVEDAKKTNRRLAKTNIAPHFVTIRGFPTETREDIYKTYLLNSNLLIENIKAICDSPFLITTPGTKIVEMCLGDQVKEYTLEDWAKIFNLGRDDKKPSWVLDETFDFIKTHRGFLSLVSRTNNSPKFTNILYRVLLRIYRFSLLHGFSKQYDWLLNIGKVLIVK